MATRIPRRKVASSLPPPLTGDALAQAQRRADANMAALLREEARPASKAASKAAPPKASRKAGDCAGALKALRHHAERGCPDAMLELGKVLFAGTETPQNYHAAAHWFRGAHLRGRTEGGWLNRVARELPAASRVCGSCYALNSRYKCPCLAARYCTRACQKAAWPTHKAACAACGPWTGGLGPPTPPDERVELRAQLEAVLQKHAETAAQLAAKRSRQRTDKLRLQAETASAEELRTTIQLFSKHVDSRQS